MFFSPFPTFLGKGAGGMGHKSSVIPYHNIIYWNKSSLQEFEYTNHFQVVSNIWKLHVNKLSNSSLYIFDALVKSIMH